MFSRDPVYRSMFLVVFRFSWCNYSLIILYDGKTELESIFGGKLKKLQWLTNSIGVLEISGFGPGWIVRMQMKTFMHRTLGNLMFLDKQCAQYVTVVVER